MSISHRVVALSYRLADSDRYQGAKHFCYGLLVDPNSRTRPFFDLSMILLVLSSVTLLVYGTYEDTGRFGQLFEILVFTLLVIEYLLRLWVHSDNHRIIIDHFERAELVDEPFRLWPAIREAFAKKWAYVRSPLAIIDLLAIIPFYRPVRLLRLFLLFRLFKLFRYANSFSGFAQVLIEKRFELMALSIFLAILVFSAASVLVIFEVDNPDSKINGFFDGIYWALVTVSTVGYGDIVPATPEGRFVALLLILAGLGVFSFLASIIVSAFSEQLPELRRRQVAGELERRGGHTIVCGFGRVGLDVAIALARDGTRVVIADPDEERCRLAKRHGFLALQGNAEQEEMLESLQVQLARRILCLTGDDVVNVYITVSARSRNPHIEIVARANQPENLSKLERAGANRTVAPFSSVGQLAAQYIGQPVAFDAMADVMNVSEGISVDAVRVSPDSRLVARTIGEVDFREHRLQLFGVLSEREGVPDPVCRSYVFSAQRFFFNPGSECRLEPEDLLILFGHEANLAHFKEWLIQGER